MTDLNESTALPGELTEPTEEQEKEADESENVENEKAKSGSTTTEASKSAERARRIPPRLRLSAKSQSMFDITTNGHIANENGAAIPSITLTGASPTLRSERTTSVDGLSGAPSSGNHLRTTRPISASTNEFQFSDNLKRLDTLDENEDRELSDRAGRQLRIRSSIVSLFARMGRSRRRSTLDSSESNADNNDAGDSSSHRPGLRNLPQIAATKILRAFSYVGKHSGKLIRNALIFCSVFACDSWHFNVDLHLFFSVSFSL